MSCDTAGGLLIYYYINFGIKLIMIMAPIILLVLGTIDFMGAVTAGDEKGMKKSIQTFLKRMIICLIILILPTIISLIMSFSPKESTLFNCLDKATKENIKLKEQEEKANKESLLKKMQKEEEEKGNNNEVEVITGNPLNIESSFKKYNDSTYWPLTGYYLYIPKNATSNMPLVVSFPPNSLSGKGFDNNQISKFNNLKAFVYVPILGNFSTRTDWNMQASNAAIKKINDLVKEYKIDESRISLTAFSSSGYYIYSTANQYRIFSCIVPVSSGMNIETIKANYNDWEYLKTLPMKGFGEKGGATTVSGRLCRYKIGWSAVKSMCPVFKALGKCSNNSDSTCSNCSNFTYMPETCHDEMGTVFSIDNDNNGISDVLEWMISQKK